ncbi:MAG TPA: hypothetical protein DDW49_00345, partial [Deltaproteobacteria bacterium]|nr:hypothetical protein [Deltaproteobacteria bacterium]
MFNPVRVPVGVLYALISATSPRPEEREEDSPITHLQLLLAKAWDGPGALSLEEWKDALSLLKTYFAYLGDEVLRYSDELAFKSLVGTEDARPVGRFWSSNVADALKPHPFVALDEQTCIHAIGEAIRITEEILRAHDSFEETANPHSIEIRILTERIRMILRETLLFVPDRPPRFVPMKAGSFTLGTMAVERLVRLDPLKHWENSQLAYQTLMGGLVQSQSRTLQVLKPGVMPATAQQESVVDP